MFHRTWDADKKAYSLKDGEFKLPGGIRVRQGSSVVSSLELAEDAQHIATRIFNYWNHSVISNVNVGGNTGDAHLHSNQMTELAIGFFCSNKQLKNNAIEILRKLGVGFHDFSQHQSKISGETYYSILHQLQQDRLLSLPIAYESSGTKRVILLLMYIVQALKEPDGIAIIDELDAYLHPDIVEALVKTFMSPETNPNKAQLLFSAHSHQLLAEFDKQQIILVEKNDKGATDVWRLDEVKGLRADDNYHTKYIAGAYAARPKIG